MSPKSAQDLELPISTFQGSEVYYGGHVGQQVLLFVAACGSMYFKTYVLDSSAMTRVVIGKIDGS